MFRRGTFCMLKAHTVLLNLRIHEGIIINRHLNTVSQSERPLPLSAKSSPNHCLVSKDPIRTNHQWRSFNPCPWTLSWEYYIQSKMSRIQLLVVKSLRVSLCERPAKRIFLWDPKCPGKVCLKFPSQCRQASFPPNSGVWNTHASVESTGTASEDHPAAEGETIGNLIIENTSSACN